MAEALSLHGGRVTLAVPQRGDKKKLVDRIAATAREALGRHLAESASQRQLLDGVAAAFGLSGPLNRIEVYDNSHIQGAHAVGAMIVAGPDGLIKNAYRKFTIRGPRGRPSLGVAPDADRPDVAEPATGGDDYAMMREVFSRRFGRALKEDPERARGQWPDLVLIDGGQGQLTAAQQVFAELGIEDLPIVSIAKGPDRNAGRERFFMPGARRSRWSRAIQCCIFCNGCATRRIASRSARIAPSGQRQLDARRSTKSRESGPSASTRCCTISARREPSREPGSPRSSG